MITVSMVRMGVHETSTVLVADGTRQHVHLMDDDSCLLWDVDGGKEELHRRRDRRKSNAQSAKEEAQAGGSIESITDALTIEEIKEEDDEK